MELSAVVLICFIAFLAVMLTVGLVARDLFVPQTQRLGSGRSRRGRKLRRRSMNVFDENPAVSITGKIDQAFDRLVLETGWDMTPSGGFLLIIAGGLVAGGGLFLYSENPLLSVVAAVLGMAALLVVLIVRRNKRMRAIHEQLPHVLELLARAVRAGHSIEQAIALLGSEAEPPLGPEFKQCTNQLELGQSVAGVMQSLAHRIRLMELRLLATVLSVHRQTGGNLPNALERMATVVRDRLNYRRQMRASTGAGRMSTMLAATIAPVLYVVMFMWQPEHFQVLLDEFAGQVLLITSTVLVVVGLIWVGLLLKTDS